MRKSRARGLTLLEMVIVVAILAAIAAAAVAVTDQADNQSRYDVTKSRADQIRTAILGPGGTINGSPVVAGFVADMGRLPATLSELITQSTLPAYDTNTSTTTAGTLTIGALPAGFGTGWRGPYLIADQESLSTVDATTPRAVFRDGWGNIAPTETPTAQDPSFGWLQTQPMLPAYLRTGASTPPFTLETWTLKSKGSDNQDDSVKAPATWDAADYALVISKDDYLVDVSGASFTVNFNTPITTSTGYKLRLHYPTTQLDGTLALDFLEAPVTSTLGNAATFARFTGASPAVVPIGVRSLVVVDASGTPVSAPTQSHPIPITVAPRVALASAPLSWNN